MLSARRSLRQLTPALSRSAVVAPVARDNAVARAHLQPAARSIVSAESLGTVMRVDNEHWSSFMFGRERQLLIHVVKTAKEGDADSVLAAMDAFWENVFSKAGTESWSVRGGVMDKVLQEKGPKNAVEIGTYCGYSSLRMGRMLPEDGLLVSIEVDPLFAAIATKIVEHAGLSHKVKIIIGTVEEKASLMATCFKGNADVLLCDHSKELFVPDLQRLENVGIMGPGTVVMGDTTVYPGDTIGEGGDDLLSYFANNPKYKVQSHQSSQAGGGITVSEWTHMV